MRILFTQLAQVDICIIANVQRPCFSPDAGIGTNEGIIKDNIKQVGIRPDYGVLDDGGINGGAIAHRYVRANNRVPDITPFTNAHRLNDHRVLISLGRHNTSPELL